MIIMIIISSIKTTGTTTTTTTYYPQIAHLAQIALTLGELLRGCFCVKEQFVHLLYVSRINFITPSCLGDDISRCQQLNCIPQRRTCANLAHRGQRLFIDADAFRFCADRHDLDHLFQRVWHRSNNQHSIQQINGNSMRSHHICSTNTTNSSIGREDHNWRQRRFQCTVQEGKTFNVQHVHFIDEQHARDELSNTLVDVSVDHSIDFRT
mmetsp:Transcript_4317/g.6978  ORF Transcript_4317/g.6978 Transcript_4317/m.6978 type:complete len:209 (+) Transcript_4317:205-831(+)